MEGLSDKLLELKMYLQNNYRLHVKGISINNDDCTIYYRVVSMLAGIPIIYIYIDNYTNLI